MWGVTFLGRKIGLASARTRRFRARLQTAKCLDSPQNDMLPSWFTLNMAAATERLRTDREKIVKAVDDMAEQHWLEVKVADLVHGYQWLRRIDQPEALADELHRRLISREHGEIQRLDSVLAMAEAGACQAATLSAHFGESIAGPCERCSACLGRGPFEIPPPIVQPIEPSTKAYIGQLAQEHPDLFESARDRARFLCGLSSPSFVRARLTRDAHFGILDDMLFADVLSQMGGLS